MYRGSLVPYFLCLQEKKSLSDLMRGCKSKSKRESQSLSAVSSCLSIFTSHWIQHGAVCICWYFVFIFVWESIFLVSSCPSFPLIKSNIIVLLVLFVSFYIFSYFSYSLLFSFYLFLSFIEFKMMLFVFALSLSFYLYLNYFFLLPIAYCICCICCTCC